LVVPSIWTTDIGTLRGFSQSSQVNVEALLEIFHQRFLTHPSLFTVTLFRALHYNLEHVDVPATFGSADAGRPLPPKGRN